jgi:hypothetical protein
MQKMGTLARAGYNIGFQDALPSYGFKTLLLLASVYHYDDLEAHS